METQRQKKINALLQQEITSLLQGAIRTQGVKNLVLSVYDLYNSTPPQEVLIKIVQSLGFCNQ